MKTKVTALPVPVSTFFVGSILRISAILLVFLLHLLTSCQQPENAIKATTPALADNAETSYRYTDIDSAGALQLKSVAQLQAFAKCPTQAFTIKVKADTVITGSKGVKVYIPADCFDLTDPNTEVKMVLKEFNSTKDFFCSGLTTTSNGQLLESGGTVYLNALCKGKAVKIKDGKEITLSFPTGKAIPKERMQTFYGDKQADGSINWNVATQPQTQRPKPFLQNKGGWKNVFDTVSFSMPSTLTKAGYRAIVLTKDQKYEQICPVFEDAQGYNNIIEYLNKNLVIPAADLPHLKGTGIEYIYSFSKDGCVTKVKLSKEGKNPNVNVNIALRRAAINRLNKNMQRVLSAMPNIDNRVYKKERIQGCFGSDSVIITNRKKGFHTVRMLFTEYSNCDDYSELNINPEKPRVKQSQVYSYDTTGNGFLKGSDAYYTLQTANLGWINCDRFANVAGPKKNMYFTGTYANLEVKVIFKDMMSVMNAEEIKPGYYKVGHIPKGYAVKVIAIDVRADGVYYAIKDTNTDKDEVVFAEFKPMTTKAVQKELDSL